MAPKNIKTVVYSDETTETYEEKPMEAFRSHFIWNEQQQDWEEDHIIPYLKMDLEKFAKQEYSLIDEDEMIELDEFSDYEIMTECIRRKLSVSHADISNENIINQDFVNRLIEIVNRGNDNEIDETLEILEKKYHIK